MNYIWTNGENVDFCRFSSDMEAYYNRLVGGEHNRKRFIPYNSLGDMQDVLMVYDGGTPVACAAFKAYDAVIAEMKRVWVTEPYRRQHIAKSMIEMLECRIRERGFRRIVLQTREQCADAVKLYQALGYSRIENYPPYDTMELAVCYGKEF